MFPRVFPKVFPRVLSRVFPDFSVESLQQRDQTWHNGALCWRHLLRMVEELGDVHSKSHACCRDKSDLAEKDAAFGEVLEEAYCWS